MNPKDWERTWSSTYFLFANKFFGIFFWKNLLSLLKNINITTKTNIIEFGCGTGESLLKLAKRYDCKVTLVDYCESVLKKTSMTFNKNKIKAKFILKDVFNIVLRKKYDLALSIGLIEHFEGKKRKSMFKIHKDAIKKNGYVIIYIPRSSFVYWFIRKTSEIIGKGYTPERPFSKEELLELCKINNLIPIKISKVFLGMWFGLLAKR